MTTQSIPQNLISLSDYVHQSKALHLEAKPDNLSQEVTIRPLPPEIDKLVRKYLSRY